MQNPVFWAEDLEGHRQPSLYYLSEEEGADGPHLICDWNGAPTDFSEIELDALTLFHEHEQSQDNSPTEEKDVNMKASGDEFVDYPNPAADITGLARNKDPKAQPTVRQNDLDLAESAHLDFLSVPPMTAGLIKRFVKHLLDLKSKCSTADTKPNKDKDESVSAL